MPSYTVTSPEGQSVTLEGDSPPTEAELNDIFSNLPQASAPPPPVLGAQFASQEEFEAAKARQMTEDPESLASKAKMAGQAVGSAALKVGLPAAAVAAAPFTGGVSLAALGSGASMLGTFLGNKVAGEQTTPGELLSAGVLGASPVKALSGAGVKQVALEGAKLAAFGYGAEAGRTMLDQNRMPTAMEAFAATAPNLLAAPAAKFLDQGTNAAQQAFLTKQSQGAEKSGILKAGQSEGYAVLPLKVRQGYQERMLNLGAGGQELSNPLAQQASINNQAITNKLARRVADVDEAAAITEDVLNQARKDAYAPYEEIAALSPQAKTNLDALKQVRRDANATWRKYSNDKNPNPELEQLARAKNAEADLLEQALHDEAKKLGRPGLVSSLKEARKNIAKIHVLESARMDGGDISAKTIAAIGQTTKLTDELKLISQMANVFPESMRASNHIVLSPGGSKVLALTRLDEAMKKVALSSSYQKGLEYYYGGQAPDAAASFARFAVPAAAASVPMDMNTVRNNIVAPSQAAPSTMPELAVPSAPAPKPAEKPKKKKSVKIIRDSKGRMESLEVLED